MGGGLFYPNQIPLVLIGTKSGATRTSWNLTSSYQTEASTQPTKSFDVGGMTRVEFAVLYTMGATETSNSIDIKIDWTTDGTNFYQLVTDSTSAGTSTLAVREFTMVGTDASTKAFTFGVDVAYKDNIRISCKETGVASNAGTVFVEALVSGR